MHIVDFHCDTVSECFIKSAGAIRLNENGSHIDITKLKKGGALAQFFAIYIPFGTAKYGYEISAYEFFNLARDCYLKEIKENESDIAPAYCFRDIIANREQGKISSILSVEDGALIEGSEDRIKDLFQKGVRLITLTWNHENSIGYPNSDDKSEMQRGLKKFGIEAVRIMNELGIIVDVSHLSDGGFYDVARHSEKPFVASHSNARSLCSVSRNLSDDMLRVIGDKGGIAGINFLSAFLAEGANRTRVEDIVRHAVHIKEKAGIEAVAFGSDFDGIDSELEFKDYSGYPLIEEMLAKHFTSREVDLICSGNALRVIKECIG
ncbi:MAG: Membrane dipeptidase (Peptidase family M19) [Firmicutes bacterium ADurb.Bin182]|nr:MAG: Membrane dipeptidase (Peptidase family M19) [Firmicutes bacterium ADurb.Bin182]